MDPWKPIRLWFGIAVIAAILAAGGWARFWWGVPEHPFGLTRVTGYSSIVTRRTINPFRELRLECGGVQPDDFDDLLFVDPDVRTH
jgi:hypothetical protein